MQLDRVNRRVAEVITRARHAESLPPDSLSMRSPATSIDPSVGVSRPPIRFSSVVLPEPEGPMSARNSPAATSRFRECSTSTRCRRIDTRF